MGNTSGKSQIILDTFDKLHGKNMYPGAVVCAFNTDISVDDYADNIIKYYSEYIENLDNECDNRKYIIPHKSKCYILRLDDPTLLHILTYLRPYDIFITVPKVCKKLAQLCDDKYVLESIKDRVYNCSGYLNYINTHPFTYTSYEELKLNLVKTYFNKFTVYFYHKNGNNQYIHGTKNVTLYAEDTLISVCNRWQLSQKSLKYIGFCADDIYLDCTTFSSKYHKCRFIDYVHNMQNLRDNYGISSMNWQHCGEMYIYDQTKKFSNYAKDVIIKPN